MQGEEGQEQRSEARNRASSWLMGNGPQVREMPVSDFDAYNEMEDLQENWDYWTEGGDSYAQRSGDMNYSLRLGL